jgi:hypothetical protein
MIKTFDNAITSISSKVNCLPIFIKIPIINTIGATIVQKIWTEISCFVRVFFCFSTNIRIRGARILNGGIITNRIEERFTNFSKE